MPRTKSTPHHISELDHRAGGGRGTTPPPPSPALGPTEEAVPEDLSVLPVARSERPSARPVLSGLVYRLQVSRRSFDTYTEEFTRVIADGDAESCRRQPHCRSAEAAVLLFPLFLHHHAHLLVIGVVIWRAVGVTPGSAQTPLLATVGADRRLILRTGAFVLLPLVAVVALGKTAVLVAVRADKTSGRATGVGTNITRAVTDAGGEAGNTSAAVHTVLDPLV